ncbi:MAG: DUF1934 domain-containing protein [Clostridiales bacterium]|nr:DUF1934 domain-containing protein [Clostridiales bacterium]
MKKDVIISISGHQFFENTSGDVIEFVTDGRYYKKDDKYYITYKESELTGLSGLTTLKIEPQKVTLMHSKPNATQLIFEKGRRHISLYETGQGALTVAVSTNSIENDLIDSGGSLKVQYSIEVNHAIAGINTFTISVKEAQNQGFKLKN